VVSCVNRHGREPLCLLGVLPLREEPLPLLRSALPDPYRSYGLMRQTSSLWPALPSLCAPVFAGCDESLLRRGPSRRYLCASFPRCLDPYPGGVLGAPTHCFPNTIGLPPVPMGSANREIPLSDFRAGVIFRVGPPVARAAPPQIRTSAINTSGSSASRLRCVNRVYHPGWWESVTLQ
jgi:hypothetical protein